MCYFFFSSYGDRRDLHSFPTRRSSDLASGGKSAAVLSPSRSTTGSPHPIISCGISEWLVVENTTPTVARRYRDRKSTRLNSSHSQISYAVFCLKKKKRYTITVGYKCLY